jgi:Lipase (class 3)
MEAKVKAAKTAESEADTVEEARSESTRTARRTRTRRRRATAITARPSIPGFSADEAIELLGMCTVANYLGPVQFAPFPKGLRPTANPDDPLPDDDGATYPFPEPRIWPQGWLPAVKSDPSRPWANSIIWSRLANGAPVNCAIVARHEDRNAYAIAFAGTLNTGAAMQDECALLVDAGGVDLPQFNFTSYENYITLSALPVKPDPRDPPPGGVVYHPPAQPPEQRPQVHLGYRAAVESLTVDPYLPSNLRRFLIEIPHREIDLYVTGHSLGASVAQLFSAWVRAGGVPHKKINVKCYSFATPKCANAPMALNYGLALGNAGFSYRVENALDTAPQLPPTKEQPADLINPAIANDLSSKAQPTGLYASSPLAPLVNQILASQSGSQQPPAVPFPFSIVAGAVEGLINAAAHANPPPPSGPPTSGPPASGPPASSPPPMGFVGMGVPHVLPAEYPVVWNGRFYPPELFPGRDYDDLVDIPDDTTREWWQHWPFNYARYVLAAEEDE